MGKNFLESTDSPLLYLPGLPLNSEVTSMVGSKYGDGRGVSFVQPFGWGKVISISFLIELFECAGIQENKPCFWDGNRR